MNYESAAELKEKLLLSAINTRLNKYDGVIYDIYILPRAEQTLLSYRGHLSIANENWMRIGFNQEDLYHSSGIYYLTNGRPSNDDLTLYAAIKYNDSEGNLQCKIELLYNFIVSGEFDFPDIQDLLLKHP